MDDFRDRLVRESSGPFFVCIGDSHKAHRESARGCRARRLEPLSSDKRGKEGADAQAGLDTPTPLEILGAPGPKRGLFRGLIRFLEKIQSRHNKTNMLF